MKAELTVNCGSMFSGKSSELMRQGERYMLAKKKVIYIKPLLDDRYSINEIVNHKGQRVEAINLEVERCKIQDLVHMHEAQVVLIDEIQFFSERIIEQIQMLLRKGIIVCCSGLDMDYTGMPFLTTAKLMAIADKVTKFQAVCEDCGDNAVFSHKTSKSEDIIELGEKDIYMPLCRACYLKRKDEK